MVRMIELGDHLAFWFFTFLFGAFLAVATVISIFIASKRPNPLKASVYECGQKPFGRTHDFRITGATRYFVYAVVFFALDAFAWVVLSVGLSVPLAPLTIRVLVLYVLIILIGFSYLLQHLRKLVR